MANFKEAFDRTLTYEGGWCNVEGDPGGETYCGIAKNYHKNWAGWVIVDSYKPLKTNQIIKDEKLDTLLESFYKTQFWDKIIGDHILSQRTADLFFDWYVNSGSPAIKHLEYIIGHSNKNIFDETDVKLLNLSDEAKVFNAYKQSRKQFIIDIIKAHPTFSKFEKGWNNRIDKFI